MNPLVVLFNFDGGVGGVGRSKTPFLGTYLRWYKVIPHTPMVVNIGTKITNVNNSTTGRIIDLGSNTKVT